MLYNYDKNFKSTKCVLLNYGSLFKFFNTDMNSNTYDVLYIKKKIHTNFIDN
jgi:hypothetical protein